jgi:hypothetical protein
MNPFGGRFIEELITGIGIFALPLLGLLSLAVPYAVLYLRDSRNEEHDPEIGLKAVAYMMFSLSILLILSGLTVIVITWVLDQTPDASYPFDFSQQVRIAAAMMVSGLAIGLFHFVVILGFTNDRRFPATKRVFVSWRLAIHSIVVMIAFTVLVVEVFQERTSWKDLKPMFGILLVWGPSWLIHLLLMRFYGGTASLPRIRRPTLED